MRSVSAEESRCRSDGDATVCRLDVGLDDLAGRVFAPAAAARDGELALNLVERVGAAIHDLADLAITDGMADADVHGSQDRSAVKQCAAI
jgi:hypothetical protein